MSKILTTIAVLIYSFSFAQNGSFELIQEVQDFSTGENVPYQINWKVNNNQSSMEFDYSGSGESNIVFLSKNDALYLYSKNINAEKKLYYKVSVNNKENYSVFATNSTTIIAGYNATKYIMKSSTKEVEFWFTEDLDINFKNAAKIFNGTDFDGIANDLPSVGFILEYTIKQNGEIVTIVNFKSANITSFNPAVFDFPVGFVLAD